MIQEERTMFDETSNISLIAVALDIPLMQCYFNNDLTVYFFDAPQHCCI